VKKVIIGLAMSLMGALAVVLAVAVLPGPSPAGATSVTPAATATPAATETPTPAPVPEPLRVVSVSPARNAKGVSFASAIKVRFSAALAADTPHPRLAPRIPGSWKLAGASTLVFTPAGHLPVYATVVLTIPAGSAGARGADGGSLAAKYTSRFTVKGPASVVRLQQLLAELGYLPLRFHPSGSTVSGASVLSLEPRDPDLVPLRPLEGSFRWRYHNIPTQMIPLWKKGRSTSLIKGAVMAFQSGHGLRADGVAGRKVWLALLGATAAHKAHKGHYDYVKVRTALPQKLFVWQDGKAIYTTLANTGISVAPTAKGTFPVYVRYRSTTMSGTNPDGTHYDDPGVPYVAYFNGGDAVHGFRRASYGSPQSLGCVELSYSSAAVVYKYDHIGTLVTVF
jgi:peptidoglycan hydrolase-like protein with peptidoglycan-binding domain